MQRHGRGQAGAEYFLEAAPCGLSGRVALVFISFVTHDSYRFSFRGKQMMAPVIRTPVSRGGDR
ncbi:hypothetical protein [Fodinicurvata halophila]|uniref:hypothetical protein n=1 Tax=Fodinicurvata halophila TaxID=1419723 RepID=UPI003633E20D